MPKTSFLELETSNFGYSHGFSSQKKWWGQILAKLTFKIPKPLFLDLEILPKICQFWVQNIKLGKIWPRHFHRLKKTWLEPKFEVFNSRNKDFGIMVPAFYLKYICRFGVQNVKLHCRKYPTISSYFGVTLPIFGTKVPQKICLINPKNYLEVVCQL